MHGSYGSYGSYSSMSSASQPIDISSSRTHSSYDSACAFPSWPQRSSLDGGRDASGGAGFGGRTSSYVSDDDLFAADFESDADSTSSALSSGAASPVGAPQALFPYAPQPTDAELLELERERAAMQREVVRFLVAEKERRRQQQLALRNKQRRGSSSSKKSSGSSSSPKSKLNNMTSAE